MNAQSGANGQGDDLKHTGHTSSSIVSANLRSWPATSAPAWGTSSASSQWIQRVLRLVKPMCWTQKGSSPSYFTGWTPVVPCEVNGPQDLSKITHRTVRYFGFTLCWRCERSRGNSTMSNGTVFGSNLAALWYPHHQCLRFPIPLQTDSICAPTLRRLAWGQSSLACLFRRRVSKSLQSPQLRIGRQLGWHPMGTSRHFFFRE